MIQLASFSFLNLYLHTGPVRAMEAEWRGPVSSVFMRQAILDAIALAKQHRIEAWIADDRKLGPLTVADLEWASSQVSPMLVRLGVKRFAMVEAEDAVNKILIRNEVAATAPHYAVEVQHFATPAEARAWACHAVV